MEDVLLVFMGLICCLQFSSFSVYRVLVRQRRLRLTETQVVKWGQQRDLPPGLGPQQLHLLAAAGQTFTGIIYLPAHLILSSLAQWGSVAL